MIKRFAINEHYTAALWQQCSDSTIPGSMTLYIVKRRVRSISPHD